MARGVKSKEFGCIWKTMFLIAMSFPEKYNPKCKTHVKKLKHFNCFYNSLQYVVPCKFCRSFMQTLIVKKIPLDFSGRIPLMYTIYLWRDTVNRKLIMQGNNCKPSPSFTEVLSYYDLLSAKCNKKQGKCI